MLKKSLFFAAVTMLAATAASANSLKPVRDFRGNFAQDFRGNCLRTQWATNSDECGFEPVAAPAPAPQVSMIQAQISYVDLIRQSIYFNIDKSNIDSDDINRINQVISEVNNSQGVQGVRFVGYADKFANYQYNQRLSDKRVTNVLNHFKSQGYFTSGNVTSAFYGDTKPVTNCDAKLPKSQLIECRSTDRRVDIEVQLIRRKIETVASNDPRINAQFANQVTVPTQNLAPNPVAPQPAPAPFAAPAPGAVPPAPHAFAPAAAPAPFVAPAPKAAPAPLATDAKGRVLPKSLQPGYRDSNYGTGLVSTQNVTTTTTEYVPVKTSKTVITKKAAAPAVEGVEAVDHLYPVYDGSKTATTAPAQAAETTGVITPPAEGATNPAAAAPAPVTPATTSSY